MEKQISVPVKLFLTIDMTFQKDICINSKEREHEIARHIFAEFISKEIVDSRCGIEWVYDLADSFYISSRSDFKSVKEGELATICYVVDCYLSGDERNVKKYYAIGISEDMVDTEKLKDIIKNIPELHSVSYVRLMSTGLAIQW